MDKERLNIFLGLKLKEIGKGLIFISGIAFAYFVVMGALYGFMYFMVKWLPEKYPNIATSINIIFLMFVIVIIFGFIYSMIKDCFKSNWREAGRIAKKKRKLELKKR